MKIKIPNFSDPRVRRSAIVLAIAAIAVLAAVTSTALTLTSQNFFCAKTCHFLMQYDVGAFEKSSHANIQCVACHIPPNIFSFAEHKVAALGELYMAVAGTYPWPINAKSELSEEIPNENCNSCHSIETRNVTPSGGVKIDHKVHIEKGVKCAYCHNRVGHPGLSVPVTEAQLEKLKEEAGKAEGKEVSKKSAEETAEEVKVVNGKFRYTNMISMEGCTRCHGLEADSKAPGKCDICHTKGFDLKPENHKVATWLSFTKAQRAEHGQRAKETGGKRYCSECHAQKFCQDCHGLKTMPHPESFKVAKGGRAEHAEIGQSNPNICRKCHTEENFCTACHHKPGYRSDMPWVSSKGSPQAHPAYVRTNGAESCFKCHDERYCSSCHTQGQPNPAFLSRRR